MKPEPAPMPTPPERSIITHTLEQAAYWLAHANELADKFRDAPGITAMIGRQRARQAFRYYGQCMADIEKHKARLWL